MDAMENRLQEEGYAVVNVGYPSRKFPVEELATRYLPQAIARCPDGVGIHFVTHSLGGILLRRYLKTNPLPNLRRVVMLGPPNQGSEVVDKLRDIPGYRTINGPAGMELGTTEGSLPRTLGPADFEVGIIAGTRSINWILSTFLPNPDDGKVSVENTRLEGMKEHIRIPVSHPFLMKSPLAIERVVAFLEAGSFGRD